MGKGGETLGYGESPPKASADHIGHWEARMAPQSWGSSPAGVEGGLYIPLLPVSGKVALCSRNITAPEKGGG